MTAQDVARQATINDGLERLADLGFTMDSGFAEHGPMVAEAISTLGHDAAVRDWIEGYRTNHRHEGVPPPKAGIDVRSEPEWRSALGDEARLMDWLVEFRRELSDAPWLDVIRTWVPRLMDGYAGGLTHGLIRTAHAVRSFPTAGAPSRLQLEELARGLAFWGGTYRVAAGTPNVRDAPLFGDDVEAAIGRHTALFARVLYAHPDVFQVPLVHAITAPTAVQNLLPHFDSQFALWTYGRLWLVSSALVARFVGPDTAVHESGVELPEPALSQSELIVRAIEHGDEHVIKLTEACLREDRLRPDPVYRVLAESMLARVKPRPRG